MITYKSTLTVESLAPFSLPSVTLEERSSLPEIAGIYFVLSGTTTILYIGKSVHLQRRWQAHHRFYQLRSFDGVRIAWLALAQLTEEELTSREEAYIDHFQPFLNTTDIPHEFDILRKKRTNVYLDEEDKRMVFYLRERFGLDSDASVVRFVLRKVAKENGYVPGTQAEFTLKFERGER